METEGLCNVSVPASYLLCYAFMLDLGRKRRRQRQEKGVCLRLDPCGKRWRTPDKFPVSCECLLQENQPLQFCKNLPKKKGFVV
jgi:hypothetical protein